MDNKEYTTKELILNTAFRLFHENGYDNTTYQSIADAIGKQRTIVQYHFPEKSLFPYIFLDRLNTNIESYLREKEHIKKNDFSSLYKLGQVNFSFLLMDEGMRRFTLELIGKREYTVKVAMLNKNGIVDYFQNTPILENFTIEEIAEDYNMVMGGAYEVLYYNLINDIDIDIAALLKKTIINFFVSLGYDAKKVSSMISKNEMDEDKLKSINEYLKKILFKY